jgi:hypothetical protein
MTAAELRVVLEFLGLPQDWLAAQLDVQDRTVRRWLAGTTPIPEFVRETIESYEAATADAVTAGIDQLGDLPDPAILTFRSDDDYRQAHPDAEWPASWHRAVVARIAQEVPGLPIQYWSAAPR